MIPLFITIPLHVDEIVIFGVLGEKRKKQENSHREVDLLDCPWHYDRHWLSLPTIRVSVKHGSTLYDVSLSRLLSTPSLSHSLTVCRRAGSLNVKSLNQIKKMYSIYKNIILYFAEIFFLFAFMLTNVIAAFLVFREWMKHHIYVRELQGGGCSWKVFFLFCSSGQVSSCCHRRICV